MCDAPVVISSPLGPIVRWLAFGAGAGGVIVAAVRALPSPALVGVCALAVVTTWAAVATILLIRSKADTRVQAAAPARPRARRTVKVLESRQVPPAALPAAEAIADPWATPTADRFET